MAVPDIGCAISGSLLQAKKRRFEFRRNVPPFSQGHDKSLAGTALSGKLLTAYQEAVRAMVSGQRWAA
jgi:hypothetical protein